MINLKKYINIRISIPEEYFELAYAMLLGQKFIGIEEKLDEIVVSYTEENWNDSARQELLESLNQIYPDTKIISEVDVLDRNWNEEWENNLKAVEISPRIAITPTNCMESCKNDIKIIINPKMSFGTGEHSTTRLVCKLMEQTVNENSKWIDVGTGTGVLAILAAKLGAKDVLAFDNNNWSIGNANENVELNSVSDFVKIQEADIDTFSMPKADGIVANLYSHLLIPNFPKFRTSLDNGGDLLVSGVMKYNEDDIINAAQDAGFKLSELKQEDEWVAFHFKAE